MTTLRLPMSMPLVYYMDNMEEIRRDIAEAEKLEDEMRAKTPSLLMQKLKEQTQKDASND